MDIRDLPTSESDTVELKSGATPPINLGDKLSKAASAFSNSDGGAFIVGINDQGNVDGSPLQIGRQDIRDWADQIVHQVSPPPKYTVSVLKELEPLPHDKCVVIVSFPRSLIAPHMAPDHRYYFRAGAHTVPASHWLVEAIRARRHVSDPRLLHLFRLKPDDAETIQLSVVCVTETPALDVELTLDPLPVMWRDSPNSFPLRISAIDKQHPFHMDLSTWHKVKERVGEDVVLRVRFSDLSGCRHEYKCALNAFDSIAPWRIGGNYGRKLSLALDMLAKTGRSIDHHLGRLLEVIVDKDNKGRVAPPYARRLKRGKRRTSS